MKVGRKLRLRPYLRAANKREHIEAKAEVGLLGSTWRARQQLLALEGGGDPMGTGGCHPSLQRSHVTLFVGDKPVGRRVLSLHGSLLASYQY